MHDRPRHQAPARALRRASLCVLAASIAGSPLAGCNAIVGIDEPYDRTSAPDASMSDHETPDDVAARADQTADGTRSAEGAAIDARADRRDGPSCEGGVSLCNPGAVDSEAQACGACNKGMQTRTRTCASDGCTWGPWLPWEACMGAVVECMPGQTDSSSQACGPCNTGTQSRTRGCTAGCTWEAWGAFDTCGKITAECLPDHWRCCGSGKWEWCYFNSCKWTGDCAPCNGSCSCP